MQTRKQSLIETMSNTGIGFVGSLLIVYVCIRVIPQPEISAITTTSLCTVWSIVRGYIIRRYFNKKKEVL